MIFYGNISLGKPIVAINLESSMFDRILEGRPVNKTNDKYLGHWFSPFKEAYFTRGLRPVYNKKTLDIHLCRRYISKINIQDYHPDEKKHISEMIIDDMEHKGYFDDYLGDNYIFINKELKDYYKKLIEGIIKNDIG